MRLIKFISISLLISVLSINNLEAQLLKKLKNRVQAATEDVIAEKAAKKAAQETDKALDSLLDIDPDYEPSYPEQLNKMMSIGSENIPVEATYTFHTVVLYHMTVDDAKNTSDIDYELWFPNQADYMATKVKNLKTADTKDMPSSILSIMDDKNQAMIILMEEQKIAQLLSMDRIKDVAVAENETDAVDTAFPEMKKTGKSKKILGYHCEEFVAENESSKYTFWITKELSWFQKNMFYNISKSLGGNTFDQIPENAKGFMMEMYFEDLQDKQKGSMKVIDIQETEKSIHMDEYQRLSLGQYMEK